MSGGPAVRTLYDLLIYWAVALVSMLIAKPLRLPPLLFYLIFGCILGNLDVVEKSYAITFFAEFSITMVFFALGFEETVDNFVDGIKRAYGIALSGGLVPFGCGYLIGIVFFPDAGWYVHIMLATAVTAKPVSLTMMVLQSVGLLKTRAAMCIMTTAVLDDIACLIGVGILVPIAVAAAPPVVSDSNGDCYTPPPVAAHLAFTGGRYSLLEGNHTEVMQFSDALSSDFESMLKLSEPVDIKRVFFNPQNVTVALSFQKGDDTVLNSSAMLGNKWMEQSLPIYQQATNSTDFSVFNSSFIEVVEEASSKSADMGAWPVTWIILKVLIFFLITYILHKAILPHDIKEGILSKIPFIRTYGAKHLLQVWGGSQVPLIVVTFGLAMGMLSAALGFHPAIGAYFAGLILDEVYFDVEVSTPDEKKASDAEPIADDVSEEIEVINTMERSKDTVGTAAFMYLGPTFFVHLGANLKIEASLAATAVPQALGIYAILVTGQWASAALGAYYFPRGMSWQEATLVGLGMLGRAELFFVVMNIAKEEGLIDVHVFFPMALAAMMMNMTLPVSISLFEPLYSKRHPQDEEEMDTVSIEEDQHATTSAIRGTGIDGFEKDVRSSRVTPRAVGSLPPSRQNSSFHRRRDSTIVSRSGSRVGSRVNSAVVKRSPNEAIIDNSKMCPACWMNEEQWKFCAKTGEKHELYEEK